MSEPKTVRDLMEATGMGRRQVRDAIRAGQLPGYCITTDPKRTQYVIPGEAFDRFVRGEWTPTKPESNGPIPFLTRRTAA